MAQTRRTAKKWLQLDLPLSYKTNEDRPRLARCSNVFSNQKRLDTRYGTAKYNSTSLGGDVLSMSFFKDVSESAYLLAKVGTVLYKVASTGSHTSLKTGLTAGNLHRGLTLNNRHIVSVESDGLFQYNGTTFTQLGQAKPTTPTVALGAGAGALSNGDWQVKITFYSSATGFETNGSTASSTVTTSSPNSRVAITSIPATAANSTIDKVRIYASIDGGNFLYVGEIGLGTTTYNLDADPTETDTPPTTAAPPISGGGKYMTVFNDQFVYAGNSTYPNDVFFSEANNPDAFNDSGTETKLYAEGDGPITGLATGFYNNSILDPFLVIFKRKSTEVYSEIGGNARKTKIDDRIGCVQHNTITVRNGVVYFLSDSGWRAIYNGRLIQDQKKEITLGNGDIDDIFKQDGFEFEVTRADIVNSFSVYYSELDQYMTFTSDNGVQNFRRAYVYEFLTLGFKLFEFPENLSSASVGEDSSGGEEVYLGDTVGWIYKHSIRMGRNDVNAAGNTVKIPVQARLIWIDGSDLSCNYNFNDLTVRALNSSEEVTVNAYVDYDTSDQSSYSLDFYSEGFALDVSRVDEDTLGDNRQLVTSQAEINRTGDNIAIEFTQEALDANIGLSQIQLDFNKNGNRNA